MNTIPPYSTFERHSLPIDAFQPSVLSPPETLLQLSPTLLRASPNQAIYYGGGKVTSSNHFSFKQSLPPTVWLLRITRDSLVCPYLGALGNEALPDIGLSIEGIRHARRA